jgi:hypothetical protein
MSMSMNMIMNPRKDSGRFRGREFSNPFEAWIF